MHDLRDYQTNLIERLRGLWHEGVRRVLLYLPTGAGKTEVAKHLAWQVAEDGGTTLFVVDRRVLVHQTEEKMRGTLSVGVLAGDRTLCRGDEHIVVATVQTLRSRWDWPFVRRLLSRVRLVVIDETHVWHKHHDDILERLSAVPVVGLTATPLRTGLGLRYQELLRGPSTRELTAQGFLVPARYFAPHAERTAEFLNGLEIAATGDYVTGQLSARMRERVLLGDAVSNWQVKAGNRPTLCFAVDIAHSKELTAEFLASGISAAHLDLHTDAEEREHLFAEFAAGRLKVLSSVYILTLGFDMPLASCLVIARPTLSHSLHIQMLGRVLRPADGKVDALIFDHALNVLRHGRAEDFEPPELSQIDKHSDYKKRDVMSSDVACPKCDAILRPGTNVCTECGRELAKRSSVHHVDAELVENQEEPFKGVTLDTVMAFFAECLWITQYKYKKDGTRYHRGWAKYKTEERFADDLPQLGLYDIPWAWCDDTTPVEPRMETLRWLKSRQIAWAKGQQKRAAQQAKSASVSPSALAVGQSAGSGRCPHCGSERLRVGPGKAMHAGRLDCLDCHRFVKWLPRAAIRQPEVQGAMLSATASVTHTMRVPG